MIDFWQRRRAHGMIRVFSLIAIVAVLSFSAGYAQSDIFLRKDRGKSEATQKKDEGPSAGGSIFLKRDYEKRPRTRGSITYGARSVISNAEKDNLRALRNLAAWQAYEGKPQTPEQVLSYAAAYRAPNQALMLKESKRVSSALGAERQARLEKYNSGRLAASGDPEEFLSADPAALARSRLAQSAAAARSGASGKAKVTRIYRKPTSTVDKPRRVFRDYR